MAGSSAIQAQKLSNSDQIKRDSVGALLNVQFQYHIPEQGRGCGKNSESVHEHSERSQLNLIER